MSWLLNHTFGADTDPFESFNNFAEKLEFATGGTVVLEVCRGLRHPPLLQRFRERFSVMVYLPTTNAIWERATQLAWTLGRRGHTLPAQDLVIAACALPNATVLTGDAHFEVIPGLQILKRLD